MYKLIYVQAGSIQPHRATCTREEVRTYAQLLGEDETVKLGQILDSRNAVVWSKAWGGAQDQAKIKAYLKEFCGYKY